MDRTDGNASRTSRAGRSEPSQTRLDRGRADCRRDWTAAAPSAGATDWRPRRLRARLDGGRAECGAINVPIVRARKSDWGFGWSVPYQRPTRAARDETVGTLGGPGPHNSPMAGAGERVWDVGCVRRSRGSKCPAVLRWRCGIYAQPHAFDGIVTSTSRYHPRNPLAVPVHVHVPVNVHVHGRFRFVHVHVPVTYP